jgi:hypothetical protein
MIWLSLLAQFLPTIIAGIKAAVDAMPDSPGHRRLEAVVQFVITAEGLVHADPADVAKAVNAVHAMIYADNQVPQAPQVTVVASAPAPAPAITSYTSP